MSKSNLLSQFETLKINPAEFGHIDHIETAFEMLCKYPFLEACTKYANIINTMATNAGAPEKFNVTVTLAFLSLIAERIEQMVDCPSFKQFLTQNQDLESTRVLRHWYTKEQLESDFARTHFLLPNKAA